MRKLLKTRGQSTLEYAVLIVVIIAALIAMQVYLKRGLQGRVRQSSDQIGEQYSPGYTESSQVTNASAHTTEMQDRAFSRTQIIDQKQNISGWERVASVGTNYTMLNKTHFSIASLPHLSTYPTHPHKHSI